MIESDWSCRENGARPSSEAIGRLGDGRAQGRQSVDQDAICASVNVQRGLALKVGGGQDCIGVPDESVQEGGRLREL
jgi:hypothetical protein